MSIKVGFFNSVNGDRAYNADDMVIYQSVNGDGIVANYQQSMQVSASITYWVSPSEIASTGQPAAQAPQLMQASEIL